MEDLSQVLGDPKQLKLESLTNAFTRFATLLMFRDWCERQEGDTRKLISNLLKVWRDDMVRRQKHRLDHIDAINDLPGGRLLSILMPREKAEAEFQLILDEAIRGLETFLFATPFEGSESVSATMTQLAQNDEL